GQQLGRDGGVQNVQQDPAQRAGGGGVGLVADQVADQGLGHPGVDAIHAHMVAVVGGPAQGQLGQIAGAHHKAAVQVGDVHQFQGADAGLAVLKGDVGGLAVVADVGKVAADGGGDVHFPEGDPQL